MNEYILSIDEGTTGTTAMIVDAKDLTVMAKVNQEFPQIFPKPGHVEHDLNDIWSAVKETISSVIKKAGIQSKEIISIGITNQRETTCAFTKKGEPLANAIVWQDRRTSKFCHEKRDLYEGLKLKTGLPLDPYFSATKMNWLLQNNSKVQSAAKENNLYLSTIDSFLLFKITGNKSFFTEASNASRTLLMDLDSCDWDQDLLSFFEIDKELLPQIKDSFTNFGVTHGLEVLPDGIPVTCILGDQQAALFGQAGYKKGDLKCTYGTGAFILLNTGKDKTYSTQNLLTTIAYKHQGEACYAIEGSCYIAGAAVQWLRDNLKIIDNSADVEGLANSIKDLDEMEHLMLLPFFTGIGSPHWKADAKAALVGITRDTEQKHIARACLDGIALAINDSIQAIIIDSEKEVTEIRVDGGASQNNLLMQIQANFSKRKITRPEVVETTGYGVALGSMLGLGKIKMIDIDKLWKKDKDFTVEKNRYFTHKQSQWDQNIKRLY